MLKMHRFFARTEGQLERLHQVGHFLGISIQSDPDDFSCTTYFIIATPKQASQFKMVLARISE